MEKTLQSKWTHISSQKVQPGKFLLLSSMNTNFVILGENVFTIPMFLFSICNNKATNDSGLKGGFYMLPWHAIPFLKGLGMLTPNPWENG